MGESQRMDMGMMQGEVRHFSTWWKPTPFPDYWVSADGRLLSTKHGKRVILKGRPEATGRLRVTMSNSGANHSAYIVRLVAEAFLGPPPEERPWVRQMDGNPRNMNVSNLKWGTRRECQQDKRRAKGLLAAERLEEMAAG